VNGATSRQPEGTATAGVANGLYANAKGEDLELSVVMPCLNEARTVERCVAAAVAAMSNAGIRGEVVVADNGSTDGSQAIAAAAGARVVPVRARGYGSALLGGFEAARGRFVLMGDADDSYDFGDIPAFVAPLRAGYELAQGCRLPSGGGRVARGAMPFLHRWWGNPMFSWLARRWFRAPIHDVHCGMRAFRRSLVTELDLRCTGMEFASEMIIKAALRGAAIAEVPTTLRPDGRGGRRPHLRTFRDGWRHLRFYLLYSPRWLFLAPGALLILAGLACYAIGLPGVRLGRATFDVHTLLFGTLFVICGYQTIIFAAYAKIFAVTSGLIPADRRVERAFELVNLERGIAAAGMLFAGGLVLLAAPALAWWRADFGPLDYRSTMRWAIPGVMCTALAVQTLVSSFFFSLLGLARRA
jgi:glycosyltransferase involved in cell wall biosynthesis